MGGSVGFGAQDLVLDPLEILEEKSIVVGWSLGRSKLPVFPWLAYNNGPDLLQLGMQAIDFGASLCLERKMMQRPWLPPMDRVACKRGSRRGDCKPQSRMGILYDTEIVRLDDGAVLAPTTESQQWKKLVVKRHRHVHVFHR